MMKTTRRMIRAVFTIAIACLLWLVPLAWLAIVTKGGKIRCLIGTRSVPTAPSVTGSPASASRSSAAWWSTRFSRSWGWCRHEHSRIRRKLGQGPPTPDPKVSFTTDDEGDDLNSLDAGIFPSETDPRVIVVIVDGDQYAVRYLTPAEARDLAAWLLAAAHYIDTKEA
ncbi:hypothetical protein HJ590_13265 [Naumannella sp. ID2617S]|nr:hypothetical protein [Naumannella sp. ID2617S]